MRRVLMLALCAAACTGDAPAPIVHVVSATPEELSPADDLADDVRILVEYEDADGDLGEGIARVHDCRGEQLVTELAIPAIAPEDVIGSPITGSLELHVTDVGAGAPGTLPPVCDELGVGALAADETVFCVVLVDAAGNAGPGDCTQSIALLP